jgi:LysR family carnitine catabolism transcriptional activator
LRDPVVERALGVLTLPGGELSAAAQALFDVLKEENLGWRVSMS